MTDYRKNKVMEVPEKIYMPNELLSEEWQRHIEGEDTEYVRTDVFIEKVCKWLKENVLFTHPRKGTKVCAVNLIAFVDAMKGE